MRVHKFINRKESNSQRVTKLNLMIKHYFVFLMLISLLLQQANES